MLKQTDTLFDEAIARGLCNQSDVMMSMDGFILCKKPLSHLHPILFEGTEFGDWRLYGIRMECDVVYSLYRMNTVIYDNGCSFSSSILSISLIELSKDIVMKLIQQQDTKQVYDAILGAVHGGVRKPDSRCITYFQQFDNQGVYLLSDVYVAQVLEQMHASDMNALELAFNMPKIQLSPMQSKGLYDMGCMHHTTLHIESTNHLTVAEYNSILISHLGNYSVHNVAAELALHARYAKSRMRAIYTRAQIADHTAGIIDRGKGSRLIEWLLVNQRIERFTRKFKKQNDAYWKETSFVLWGESSDSIDG